MTRLPERPDDFAALRAVSARFGADPLLVQGAGGNTSVKTGDVMWIKASGTLLAEAETRDIFVGVDLSAMIAAFESGEERADRPAEFALSREGLRPSIETSLHAVFRDRVVLHAHCINTIVSAIRKDARERLGDKLSRFDWAFVDYAKPGARLAAKVRDARKATTNVVILGNHGLIVSGATVDEAADRLVAVSAALAAPVAKAPGPNLPELARLCGAHYTPAPQNHPLHIVALRPRLTAVAAAGSLYPDHVVFCGPGATALGPDDDADGLAIRFAASGLEAPPFLLAPGAGALLRRDASAGALAMARCLGDVLVRTEEGAALNYLTDAETRELLDWDAEKYRQSLNVR